MTSIELLETWSELVEVRRWLRSHPGMNPEDRKHAQLLRRSYQRKVQRLNRLCRVLGVPAPETLTRLTNDLTGGMQSEIQVA